MKQDWNEDVLSFWFEELSESDWFERKDETDTAIRERFEPLYLELSQKIPEAAATAPHVALAAIIALDQFPRNMYRGTAQAFSTDDHAVRLARQAVDAGLDAALASREKPFLYMPFMHSEILADQERCVDLFRALGSAEGVKYAVEHRDIIAEFGRFPHRNKALGRESTTAEKEFLTRHAGFGQ